MTEIPNKPDNQLAGIRRRFFMRKIITAVFSGLLSLAMSGSFANAQTVLRLSTQVAAPHPFIDVAEYFKAEVEKRSKGLLQVKLFPNASLGKDPAVINELKLGTVDLMISSTNNAAKQLKEIQIFDLYYIFPDYDLFKKVVAPTSPVSKKIESIAVQRKLGFRFLSLFGSGTRNLANAAGPVKTVADVKGLKMRVPPNKVIAQIWQAFGTVPVTVAWPELYAAIQTGVAQSLEATLSGYNGSKLYEVAPNLALTHHSINGSYLAISEITFQKLSPENRKLLQDVAAEAGLIGTQKGIDADENLAGQLAAKHGVKVTKPDVSGFIKIVQPMHDQFAKDIGATELLKMIRDTK
jgi:tripartite ATP-independent transporter DctP family solute receptor